MSYVVVMPCRYLRQETYLIGSLVGFLTHLVYGLTNRGISDEKYIEYVRGFLNEYLIEVLKAVFRGRIGEHVF